MDTCGVLHLHGFPGLFGGLAAIMTVDEINRGSQIKGILLTVVLSVVSGLIVGKILSLAGRMKEPYIDSNEFCD